MGAYILSAPHWDLHFCMAWFCFKFSRLSFIGREVIHSCSASVLSPHQCRYCPWPTTFASVPRSPAFRDDLGILALCLHLARGFSVTIMLNSSFNKGIGSSMIKLLARGTAVRTLATRVKHKTRCASILAASGRTNTLSSAMRHTTQSYPWR